MNLPALCKDQLFLHTALWLGDAIARVPLDYGTDFTFALFVDSPSEFRGRTGLLDAGTEFRLQS